MKKITILEITICITILIITGCGKAELQEDNISLPRNQKTNTTNTTENTETDTSKAELEETDLTFDDLSKKDFSYSSGAGGWSEDFYIRKDGSFTGSYHDIDMGDTGDTYPNGTVYASAYSGHFTDLIKVSDYVYEMKLSDISYDEEDETEEYGDGYHYIYTTSSCFNEADVLTIYLPGMPVKEIPEEVYSWIAWSEESNTELTEIAMADLKNGIGMFSYDRISPLEDAKMNYNSYKESYDSYSDKAASAMNTAEMVENSSQMYKASDECLNYIWNLIKYNVEEERYKEILAEQREWIKQKEEKGNEIKESNDGSLMPVDYNTVMADMTMKRCEKLIEYLNW